MANQNEIQKLVRIKKIIDGIFDQLFSIVEISSTELYERVKQDNILADKFRSGIQFDRFLRNQHQENILKQIIPNYSVNNSSHEKYQWLFYRDRNVHNQVRPKPKNTFKTTEYEVFKAYCEKNLNSNQGREGSGSLTFYNKFSIDGRIKFELDELNKLMEGNLPKVPMNREELIDYCAHDNSYIQKLIAILDWGEMRISNATQFFARLKDYEDVLDTLFSGAIVDPLDMYIYLYKLDMKYCNQAYYTKFIYFISHAYGFRKKGYIMDQWSAKSMCLLLDNKFININLDGSVNKNNDPIVYRNFCNKVEDLSISLTEDLGYEISGAKVEELLFDIAGSRGEWRNYVRDRFE